MGREQIDIAWLLLLVPSLLGPARLSAQVSPHARMPEDGETFCGQVVLRADGRVIGHEFVEFFFHPSVAGRAEGAFEPELEGPVRADRAALWWRISADSVGAYMTGDEGTVWELRLGRGRVTLEGTLRRVFPGAAAAHVASAYTMTRPCPESGREGGAGGSKRDGPLRRISNR